MKKTIQVAVFMCISLMFCSFASQKDGKVVLVVSLEVKDFTEWKKGFDAGAPLREKAGIKVISVCSALDNEKQVTVIEEADNLKAANDFVALLKAKLKEDDFNKYKITIYDKVN